VYVYQREGTSWVEEARLTASDGFHGDFFGIGLAIDGDRIAVGATGNFIRPNPDPGLGAVYIFEKDGTGWVEKLKLVPSGSEPADLFGDDVSLSGDLAVIAAPAPKWVGGSGNGRTYVFRYDGREWIEEYRLISGTNDLSGETIVIGQGSDDNRGQDSGAAYVYACPAETSFLRGDCNDDGEVNLSDAACALNWLFAGALAPGCLAALNTNGDDDVNIADPVSLLNFLFAGGPTPVAPFPDCGPAILSADAELGCANPPDCQ
jgi:hypothetical protein